MQEKKKIEETSIADDKSYQKQVKWANIRTNKQMSTRNQTLRSTVLTRVNNQYQSYSPT